MAKKLINLSLVMMLTVVAMITVPTALADPASPIEMTVVDTPDPVASGSQIEYTITMRNSGGSRVDNVILRDQINGVGGIGTPPKLQITSTRGTCTQTTTLVTCSAGTIEGRGVWTVTIRGIVTAADGTVINNTATVALTHTAQNFNTTVTTSTMVSGGSGSLRPDLTISKNGPSLVERLTPMAYTLTVNNIGTVPAVNVRVMDTVPAGLTAITASGTSLFVCSVAGQTVTCDGGAVNQGSNATITINALAPFATGTITNTAVVDPDDLIPEGNELNNTSALVNTNVVSTTTTPELTLAVTDSPDPIVPDEILTYTAFVTNPASSRADDVEIVINTQGLDASQVTAVHVITDGMEGNNGGCWVTASEARCRTRALNSGGTILMTVKGPIIASAGSTIISTAAVSGNIKNKGVVTRATSFTTVKPAIDLTVTKSDSPDPVCAASWPINPPALPHSVLGDAVCLGGLTYTFVVGNSGIKPAENVLLRDPLPAGSRLDRVVSAGAFTGGCSAPLPGNILTCTGGLIAPESTTTVVVTIIAPPGTGTIQNTVTVDPNNAIFEADETNNTFTQLTTVSTGIDLTILKVDSPADTPVASPLGFDPIATSGTQTYVITVDNLGPQNASNIRVVDALPEGTRFRSVTADNGFTCSHSSGVVTCIGGSILGTLAEFYPGSGSGDDTATITIRVFAQPIIGSMHNEVRVDPLNEIPEINENNNIDIEDTVVTSGGDEIGSFNQFEIKKTQASPDKDNTSRNAPITWIIEVKNDGTDPAVGVTVRDMLPAGARYIEATGTNHFLCSESGNVVNCVGGEIVSQATATITVKAFAPDTPGTYTNQAIVDPDNDIPEGNEFDNQANAVTNVVNNGEGDFYDLSITKEQTDPDPAVPTARNAEVTYSIKFKNDGSDPVNVVTIRDMLPAGSRYIEAKDASGANQFLCTHSGGIINCVGGELAGGGGSAEITVRMFAPDTPGSYTNQALVDPDNTVPEGDELNNSAQVPLNVQNGGAGAYNDLSVVKTDTPDPVRPRGEVTFNLAVSNSGEADALNVSVRDVLPAGVTFVSAGDAAPATPGAFTCSQSGGVVNCNGGTVPAGGSRTVRVVVKAPNENGTLTNQALVDPDNDIPEGDETNNTSTTTTQVASVINLTIKKDGPDESSQSEVEDYVITVKNEAPGNNAADGDTAFGVVVYDPLPIGLIPLAVNAGTGNNWGCAVSENPINEVTCVGDLNPEQEITITITVFMTAENNRSLDNEACVDPDDLIEEFVPESGVNDNCSTATTPVGPAPKTRPDLVLTKTAGSASATPDTDLTYTVSVNNAGDAAAFGTITVTDEVPAQTTFVSATGTDWTCNESGGTITCELASGLAAGATANDITIVVHVSVDATGAITNTAVAAPAQADPSDSTQAAEAIVDNNSDTIVRTVGEPGFDLILASIVDTPDPAQRGELLSYTVVGINTGGASANGVVIDITLPPSGLTLTGATGSNGFNCGAPASNVISCTGDLPAGGDTAITLNFLVNFGSPNSLELSAEIDPSNAFAEPGDDSNNTQTETTSVPDTGCAIPICIDLVALTMTDSPDPVAAGADVTYTLKVVNVGAVSTNVYGPALVWFDVFGDVAVGAVPTGDNGWTCTNTVTVPGAGALYDCTGDIDPGETITLTLTATANTAGTVSARGLADPTNAIIEIDDFEGESPNFESFGNNLSVQATTVNP